MIARLTGLVLAVLAVLLAAGAPASAHHVDVSATLSCTGIVSFTATAWQSTSEAGRTNAQIRVSYSIDGRDFVALPAKRTYAFSAANRFTFSDSFLLGRPLPRSVVVAAQSTGPWSDSTEAGAPHTTGPLVVPSCPARPATPASSPDPGARQRCDPAAGQRPGLVANQRGDRCPGADDEAERRGVERFACEHRTDRSRRRAVRDLARCRRVGVAASTPCLAGVSRAASGSSARWWRPRPASRAAWRRWPSRR